MRRVWISLENRRPPVERQVLVYCDCHPEYGPPCMAVDWLVRGDGSKDGGWFFSEALDNPTHWMELPDVPRRFRTKDSGTRGGKADKKSVHAAGRLGKKS